ncbi:MAG: hypothetical protein ABSC13_05470 [Dehalococcoidia bacterium]
MPQTDGPMARKMQADMAVEMTAARLRQLLQEAVALLDPFPPFPGSFFTLAIEVEGGTASGPDHGCIVLAPDGELHELEVSVSFSPGDSDPVSARNEVLKPLDLHPRDYVVYAYNALTRVTELLMEQQSGESA